MKISKKIMLSLVAVVAIGTLAACSSNKSANGKTDVVIATDGSTQPFDYTDNQGNVTGYDIEVAREVFKHLPQYNVEFKVTDFAGITPGLDSGRFQMAANDFGWQKEREAKYNFSYPLSKSNNAVLVKSGNYSTFADLAGKKTISNPASNYTTMMKAWNDANPNKQINIQYSSDASISNRFSQIESGQIDFMLYDKISLASTIKDHGYSDLKIEDIKDNSTPDPKHDGYEYFLFPKDQAGTQLTKDVNAELAKLQADGTLAKLSEKYLGGNFVPDATQFK